MREIWDTLFDDRFLLHLGTMWQNTGVGDAGREKGVDKREKGRNDEGRERRI